MHPEFMNLKAYIHTAGSGRVHLRVRQDRYIESMKARMQRVGSPAMWDQSMWEWDYPLTPAAVTELHRIADETGSIIEWSDDLRDYAEYYRQLENYEENVRVAIERAIRNNEPLEGYPTNDHNAQMPPFRHQSVSYHWALRTSGLLLAHEPGLGKTRSGADAAGGWYRQNIIAPMSQRWNPASRAWNGPKDQTSPPRGAWSVQGGILVVCPKVMIGTWMTEFRNWQSMLALDISGGRKRKIERAGTIAHAHVVNYESLSLLLDVGNQYDALIVDESHKCANNSNQMQNVLQLAMRAKRRLLLTGTPVSNNLEAVFYQMLICDGGRALGSSKTRFLEQYFNSEAVGNGQTKYFPREGAVEEVSAKMARSTYFLKKDEVLDLPQKTHTPVYLEMRPDQARYYKQLRDETVSFIQDSTVSVEMAATRMMKLAQICQGFVRTDDGTDRHFNDVKTDTLVDMLTGSYSGHKVVVWARFQYEIERLCQKLRDAGVLYLRYDGTTKQADRERAVEVWNHDPNVRVFVGQIQMGIGITLHAKDCPIPCANSIYLGMDFSYVNWQQSMDRIHRIGQQYPCSYTYLLTEQGIDRRMYDAVLAKDGIAQAVHRQGKEFYLSLLKDDTPNLAMID